MISHALQKQQTNITRHLNDYASHKKTTSENSRSDIDSVKAKVDVNTIELHTLTKAGGTLDSIKSDLINDINAVNNKTITNAEQLFDILRSGGPACHEK